LHALVLAGVSLQEILHLFTHSHHQGLLSFAYIHFSAAFSQSLLVFTFSFFVMIGQRTHCCSGRFSEYIRFYTPG
jgi:hypothetical protein